MNKLDYVVKFIVEDLGDGLAVVLYGFASLAAMFGLIMIGVLMPIQVIETIRGQDTKLMGVLGLAVVLEIPMLAILRIPYALGQLSKK